MSRRSSVVRAGTTANISIYLLVVVSKHSPYLLAVFFSNPVKLTFLHLRMVADDFRSNLEMGGAILSRLEVFMCANREHLALLRHLESGIHTDSVIATHLLRIHASHAGADNNIRHFVHT